MPKTSMLDEAQSQFEDLKHRMGLLERVKNGLGTLVAKGTSLSAEDVQGEAGKLVAAGLKPQAMAALLSQMPTKPEMLQAWVQNLEDMTMEREAQLHEQMTQARHQMGVAGMISLAGLMHGASQAGQAAAQASVSPTAAPSGSDLAPPPPAESPAGSNALGI